VNILERLRPGQVAALVAAAAIAGCSVAPAASAPGSPSSSPAVVGIGPACAPPDAAVVGGSDLNTWSASAGSVNTLAASLTFNVRGGSVSSAEVIVGAPDAVSDPTELSSSNSPMVLARTAVAGFGAASSTDHPFSIAYTPSTAGVRLPVFVIVSYSTGAACNADGVTAEPLGWIDVK
jgi:hypothetical protein